MTFRTSRSTPSVILNFTRQESTAISLRNSKTHIMNNRHGTNVTVGLPRRLHRVPNTSVRILNKVGEVNCPRRTNNTQRRLNRPRHSNIAPHRQVMNTFLLRRNVGRPKVRAITLHYHLRRNLRLYPHGPKLGKNNKGYSPRKVRKFSRFTPHPHTRITGHSLRNHTGTTKDNVNLRQHIKRGHVYH